MVCKYEEPAILYERSEILDRPYDAEPFLFPCIPFNLVGGKAPGCKGDWTFSTSLRVALQEYGSEALV